MKAEQFHKAVDQLALLLNQNLPEINEKMALNAYAMMHDRIVNEGTIGENKSLGKYSDNEMPAFFFKDKALNKKGDEFYLSRSKKGEGISYKEWREANNRPTDHVSLSFSGTTLKDIGVVKHITQGTKVITVVGPKNTKTRKDGKSTDDVAGFLVNQYGDFLDPNREEEAKLQKFLDNEVNKLIKIAFK